MQNHPKIDAYLQKVQPFALPIMLHLRELVHTACPQVEEAWKWSFPHFLYRGNILCSMAAFSKHCAFGFWLAAEMNDPQDILREGVERNAMGHLGKITSVADLPTDNTLIRYIQHAAELIDLGVTQKKKQAKEKKELIIPTYFKKELIQNKKAAATFTQFSESCKREYLDWITEAKTEATREKRIAQTLIWLEEGKKRNWKYEKC
jgi:uncharacterized protein YdeI (YjbR/CyaY-like superfamily)